ncbi:MAG: HD domain-containing protein [Candidatus Hydrogenedentota bacterium]|nr:MAG: HD domain-containing protein [Candidatus Hydrogenedentota bacterium]
MPSLSKRLIAAEMRKVFGEDEKRIAHAQSVLFFAERILLEEPGDSEVVVAAALLHDIGIHEAERKHGSNAGRYQEIEGPPIAERILESLGADPKLVSEVCDIISHHHSPQKKETLNFKILYDADLLVNLRDEVHPSRWAGLGEKMKKMFFTATGLNVARKELLR